MSLQAETIAKIRDLAQGVSEREGCILYDIEFAGGSHGRVLRVFIDKTEGQVGLDDCANVSRGLNLLLDVEDVIPGGAYDLEVSTPGVERRLIEPWHYQKALEQNVRLKLAAPSSGGVSERSPRHTLEGKLKEARATELVLEVSGSEWQEPLSNVIRGQVVFLQPTKERPGKGAKKKR